MTQQPDNSTAHVLASARASAARKADDPAPTPSVADVFASHVTKLSGGLPCECCGDAERLGRLYCSACGELTHAERLNIIMLRGILEALEGAAGHLASIAEKA